MCVYPTRCNSELYTFISLQIYSICFGCHLHPSSGVQETVVVGHWYKSYERHVRLDDVEVQNRQIYRDMSCTSGLRLQFPVLLMMGVNGTRNMKSKFAVK
jgi:hypothetical protein